MRRFLWAIVLLIASFTGQAQNRDYKAYRDSTNKLSCGPIDSITLGQITYWLERLDTTAFAKNMQLYYKDLGWAYYRKYMETKDTADMRKAATIYMHRINESKNYWNLAFCLFHLGDCALANYYLQQYKNNTEKKYWQAKDQIDLMTAKCK